MVITISENSCGTLVLRCRNPKFVNEFSGDELVIDKRFLFSTMWTISDCVNNKLKDECCFDVE